MDEFKIPIFKKTYELYQNIYSLRLSIPKQDRYTLWQKVENTNLNILEGLLQASSLYKQDKLLVLEKVSIQLNMFRIFIRLMKDSKIINGTKYLNLQQKIDEVGRMLGGWIRSLKEPEQSK